MLDHLDTALLGLVNRGFGEPVDRWLTALGDWHALRPFGLVAVLVALGAGGRRWRGTLGLLAVALVVVDPLSSDLIKHRVERARPCQELAVTLRTEHCPRSPSFPSSHAVNVATAAVLIGLRHPPLMAPLVAVAVLVALSRVHSGVHYPSDVLAGLALGSGVAVALARGARARAARRAASRVRRGLVRRFVAGGDAERRAWATVAITAVAAAAGVWLAAALSGTADVTTVEASSWIRSAEPTPVAPLDARDARLWATANGLGAAALLATLGARGSARLRHGALTLALAGSLPLAIAGAALWVPTAPATTLALAWLALARCALERARVASWLLACASIAAASTLDARALWLVPGPLVALAPRRRQQAGEPTIDRAAALLALGVAVAPAAIALATRGAPASAGLTPGELALAIPPWSLVGLTAACALAWRGTPGDRQLVVAATAAWTGAIARPGAGVDPWLATLAALVSCAAAAPALARGLARPGRVRRRLRRGVAVAWLLAMAASLLLVQPVRWMRYAPRALGFPHPLGHVLGAGELAAHLATRSDHWRSTRGVVPVLLFDEAGEAAQLALYTGRPAFAVPRDPAPDGGDGTHGAAPPRGADALYLTRRAGLAWRVALAFDHCRPEPGFETFRAEERVRWGELFHCEGFSGWPG